MSAHEWPPDGSCVWGPWMNHTARKGKVPAKQYRQCVHPTCHEVQYRQAAAG